MTQLFYSYVLTQENENLGSYRKLYTNVQTALIVIVTSKNNPKIFQQVNG